MIRVVRVRRNRSPIGRRRTFTRDGFPWPVRTRVFHATSALDAIAHEGFRTRAQGVSSALGGNWGRSVSFTLSWPRAGAIALGLDTLVRGARKVMSCVELAERLLDEVPESLVWGVKNGNLQGIATASDDRTYFKQLVQALSYLDRGWWMLSVFPGSPRPEARGAMHISHINKQITVVSDAEWDLSRARDVPVRALVPTVVPTRAARPEPSEDQMRAERERAETARRVASARAGLADVNRQIRMLERDLDEAERFGSPEEAAEIQAKLVALNAEAAGFEATLKTKNPRRNPRRNSDERIRELERAFDEARTSRVARDRFLTAVLRSGLLTDVERRRIEQPVQVDADASEDERLRMERGREVDIEEIALDLLNPAFEKFVSWDQIYERMQRVSRDEEARDDRPGLLSLGRRCSFSQPP
jgi:hypothetical protein